MNGIIGKLFEKGRFKALISTFKFSDNPYTDTELRRDFEQEIILQLLQYKDRKSLRRMYKRGELDYFILGVIKRQFLQSGSVYSRDYKQWEQRRVSIRQYER